MPSVLSNHFRGLIAAIRYRREFVHLRAFNKQSCLFLKVFSPRISAPAKGAYVPSSPASQELVRFRCMSSASNSEGNSNARKPQHIFRTCNVCRRCLCNPWAKQLHGDGVQCCFRSEKNSAAHGRDRGRFRPDDWFRRAWSRHSARCIPADIGSGSHRRGRLAFLACMAARKSCFRTPGKRRHTKPAGHRGPPFDHFGGGHVSMGKPQSLDHGAWS
ncbi:hypothetical protein SAMN05421850_102460 [Lutimaribacter saemankumensis]|uniref:Uncharacterized protein n=1 Tax=Lutimaribacter saemankumensis TaxID=490829 RepID=A0A1G8K9U6_9RHOB|nr:hypothetical protein SAMN05421850_102460 [Lutimaribacter saemankumensis]